MGTVYASIKKCAEPYNTPYESYSYIPEEMHPNRKMETPDVHSPCTQCEGKDRRQPGNPGTWEELHKNVLSLYPVNFEGLRLSVKKKLSQHFNVKHIIMLSNITPTGYNFEANYIGAKRVDPHEKYPILKGTITPEGNMSASVAHVLGCRCRLKLSTQVKKQRYETCNSSLEYRSNDMTVSTKLANVDFLKLRGALNVQYLQALSPRLALGAEIRCERHSNLPIGLQTAMSGAFRYSTGQKTVSMIIGEPGVHICYHHIASRHLQLGLEIETNMKTHKTLSKIVYQVNIPKADMIFNGIVNSEWSVGAVLEKKLEPIPAASLLLSCFLNHREQRLLVGIGVNIG